MKILTSIKGNNLVTNVRKKMRNNPILNLGKMDAYTKLKWRFQRKTLPPPPPPQPQIELASMLTKVLISSLLCHYDTIYRVWLKSINYFMGEHTETQFCSKCEKPTGSEKAFFSL